MMADFKFISLPQIFRSVTSASKHVNSLQTARRVRSLFRFADGYLHVC